MRLPEKHLSSACVDLQGNLIAIGTMTHPPDDEGQFPSPELERLKISRTGPLMRIERCTATREESGFFHSEVSGAALILPEAFTAIIRHVLRFGAREPMDAAISHQD